MLFLLFSGIGDEAASPSPSPSAALELIETPAFVGRFEGPAERTAERRGLILEKDYLETDEVAAGRVIDQLPEAGVEIAIGTTVQITVATRTETVVVPDVSGIIEAKALDQLEASGLVAGQRFAAEDQLPEGYVISTAPRAGVSMTRGSIVDYLVSAGPITHATPGPVKTRKPRKTRRPTSAPTAPPTAPPTAAPTPGATLGTSGGATAVPTSPPTVAPTQLPSTVPTQPPTAMPTVPPTPTTSLPPFVSPSPFLSPLASASPPPSPFPSLEAALVGDFLCVDLATARGQLEEAGLLIGATIPSDPPPEDNWIIHDQLPKPGESVPIGSAVHLELLDPLEPCPAG